jgi:hypothetical protein
MAICESCGSATQPGALFCPHCGKPLKAGSTENVPDPVGVAREAVAAPGVAAPSLAASPNTAIGENAFTWPFQQQNWPSRLWILFLSWIPVFGWLPALTITFGWMMDAIGRRAHGNADTLPHPRNLLQMFVHGILYWLMLLLYVAVPIWLLGAIFAAETAIITQEFHQWVMNSAENVTITAVNIVASGIGVSEQIALTPQQTLAELIQHWAVVYTAGFFLPVVWVVFAVPVFFAATIRFAVTGKFGSYFRPIANTGFVLRHFLGFLWLFAVIIAVNVVAGLLPVIGIYLWFTLGIWIVAYYAGRLGTKLHSQA